MRVETGYNEGRLVVQNIGIVTKGIPNIADGRVFYAFARIGGVIDPPLIEIAGIDPELLEKFEVCTKEGVRVETKPVDENDSLMCVECDRPLSRSLVRHTYGWMYTVLYCPQHPRKGLLDIFPKYDQGEDWDFKNAFYGFGIGSAIPEGVVVEKGISEDEEYAYMRRHIGPTYLLTPDSLKRLSNNPLKHLSRDVMLKTVPYLLYRLGGDAVMDLYIKRFLD